MSKNKYHRRRKTKIFKRNSKYITLKTPKYELPNLELLKIEPLSTRMKVHMLKGRLPKRYCHVIKPSPLPPPPKKVNNYE